MSKRDDSIDQFIKDASSELDGGDEMSSDARARYDEYRGRRGSEMNLWKTWQQSGYQPQHLEPLLKSLQPVIRSEANKRLQGLGGSIPRSAIENELRNAAVKSLKSYKPEKAALTTHVTGGFRRISDFVNANRNARYVPGEDMKRYDAFRNATSELHYELGRAPTVDELQQRLPWAPRTIKKMQRSFGSEFYTDMGDDLSSSDAHATLSPRDALALVHSELSPVEQQFGRLYFPEEGVKQPSIKNIAKALSIPEHRAYRLKANVETRVGKIMKRQ